MAKARYKDEDVDLIREANAADPGFVAGNSQALIRNGKGEKSVVPLGDVLLYAVPAVPASGEKVIAPPLLASKDDFGTKRK